MITRSLPMWLKANPVISSMVQDIKPQVLTDGHSDPALTYTLQYDNRPRVFEGISTLREAGFQIDCWATRYDTAKNLAEAVAEELVSHVGDFGEDIAEQIDIESERDSFESPTKLHRATVIVSIWYV